MCFSMGSSNGSEEDPRTFEFFFHLFIYSLFSTSPAAKKDCLRFTFCFFLDPWRGV